MPNSSLDQKQLKALDELKQTLEQSGDYSPAKDGSDPSHSDATLIRFLRARRYSPTNAAQHFRTVEKWRAQHDVDNLYKTGFDLKEFEDMKKFYPRFTGRRDKRGLPLYVIALYEYMLNFAFSICTALPPPESGSTSAVPSHIAQSTTIIDMQDTTLRQLIKLRSHLQEASTLATANYPETLGMIFVVGAPGWWSTVWGWVKGWFDEQTRAKVHILPNPLTKSNALFDSVPMSSLPKEYGGELPWVYADDPLLDEPEVELLRRAGMGADEKFVPGPISLVQQKPGEWTLERFGKKEA
ncbi:hypothetical protein FRC09_004555 [Ceratobasidium sp. 395]|nr:hypothetical protein FRC09_004555 [Ceratobasidium sp. 395]